MIFINKPANGPDAVGGIFPGTFDTPARNRTGGTTAFGDVVMMPVLPGIAAEIATNDSNSYLPGYSNDTIWNSVVVPTAGGITAGFYAAVCVSPAGVADNAIGLHRYFGIIPQAFVIDGTNRNTTAGDPLTITTAKNFDAIVATNECVYAWYIDVQGTNATRRKRRVFLHNGFAPSARDLS
jgi:hypothetical protein